MQRQKQCFNHFSAPARLTLDVLKKISPQKRRRKTPERINPPTPPLLRYLVENNHVLLTKLLPPTQTRTRTMNKVSTAVEDKDKITTLLLQVSILFLGRKRRTLPKSSAISVIEKSIMPTSVLEIRKKSQKTSVSLDKLHAGDWD